MYFDSKLKDVYFGVHLKTILVQVLAWRRNSEAVWLFLHIYSDVRSQNGISCNWNLTFVTQLSRPPHGIPKYSWFMWVLFQASQFQANPLDCRKKYE